MPGEPFLGEIYMSGFNFVPQNFASCSGQLFAISTNTALFALLGTTFGGNGQTNFALPDLRGRVPVAQGSGSGLTPRVLGEVSGTETVTLLTDQIPAHRHGMKAVSDPGNTSAPANAYLANTGALDTEYNTSGTKTAMNRGVIGSTGGDQPHDNMPPYLVLNFYIALVGIFPSRN
jgi:microcystin-dependent protein